MGNIEEKVSAPLEDKRLNKALDFQRFILWSVAVFDAIAALDNFFSAHGDKGVAFWQLISVMWIGNLLLMNGAVKSWREMAKDGLKISDALMKHSEETQAVLWDVRREILLPIFEKDGKYVIVDTGSQKGIFCKKCRLTSWNENDVKKIYCGNCHEFLK